MVGRYDSRLTGPRDTSGGPYDPTTDPSLKDILDAASVLRYLREELGYKSDLFYQGPFGGGYPPPTAFRGDWMSVRWNRDPPAAAGRGGGATPAPPAGLAAALAADPDLRVFHACGYFDMAMRLPRERLRRPQCRAGARAARELARLRRRPRHVHRRRRPSSAPGRRRPLHPGWRSQVSRWLALAAVTDARRRRARTAERDVSGTAARDVAPADPHQRITR